MALLPDIEWDMADFPMNHIATASVENDMDSAMRQVAPANNQENFQNYFNQPNQQDAVLIGPNSVKKRNPMQVNNDFNDLPNVMEFDPVNQDRGPEYRFRVAAINAIYCAEWGETSPYMKRSSGFPGLPTNIEISNSVKGALVKWNPPPTPIADPVTEYSLHIAMEPKPNQDHAYAGNANRFLRIYVGPAHECVLTATLLAAAYEIDCFQPLILRIAARNGMGYGPAVQIRWLPDPPKRATIPMSTIMEDDEVTVVQMARKRPNSSDGSCDVMLPYQIKKSK